MSTVVFDNRVVTTPTFFGSEPRSVGDWSIFDHEEDAGVALIRALGDRQRREAIIHPSIDPAEFPDLQHPFDGRQASGVGPWYGPWGDSDAFYYRVHSQVVLIEFDHHPGVIFDNDVPDRHHIHMLVRTPNGGDYGGDLLADHHGRFDHSSGRHVVQ